MSPLRQSALSVYPSPLRNWDSFSWIRSKPFREPRFDGLPFPISLVPIASHPRISCAPPLRNIVLAYRLLAHLAFTTVLELEHVNPVCSELARGGSPFDLSERERNDALRIYCDEGGHALFVELLAKTVENQFGIQRERLGVPRFHLKMKALIRFKTNLPESILRHFFVSISETLVTKILRDIPYDSNVAAPVRGVIGDHAADEACHSVYFRWYFPRLWRSIAEKDRQLMEEVLPDLIWIFLEPDRELDERILGAVGFSERDSRIIVFEAYDPAAIVSTVSNAAAPTMEMFRGAGVLESRQAIDRFSKRGLL